MMATAKKKRRYCVDLSEHHALCEMNFHQILRLLPGVLDGETCWEFAAGGEWALLRVCARVVDSAPYTTTVALEQTHHQLSAPRIVVRLYHDVNMAEIVSWDHHRHWHPQYAYPNANMYQPNEKVALNQFLGEWLRYCRDQGRHGAKTVIQFS